MGILSYIFMSVVCYLVTNAAFDFFGKIYKVDLNAMVFTRLLSLIHAVCWPLLLPLSMLVALFSCTISLMIRLTKICNRVANILLPVRKSIYQGSAQPAKKDRCGEIFNIYQQEFKNLAIWFVLLFDPLKY